MAMYETYTSTVNLLPLDIELTYLISSTGRFLKIPAFISKGADCPGSRSLGSVYVKSLPNVELVPS